ERLLSDGIDPNRVSVVTNGVDREMLLREDDVPPPRWAPESFKMLYVGAITTERGLDDIIRALPLIGDRIPLADLYIAGSGNDESRLRSIVADLKLEDKVHFLGWVPFHQIHAYVSHSDLCLVPHVYNEFINTTIPNKLFQYMALAKPVLVSNARPLA